MLGFSFCVCANIVVLFVFAKRLAYVVLKAHV